nr:PREDICTED: uncharacterized protein LOC105664391 [Megachile rotundata]
MQQTYDRITIPKIVVCSKSSLDERVDADDCERRLIQRRMMRSRNRRHSRRFSTSIVDRRSPSSSRSPSPSFNRSRSHIETSTDDPEDQDETRITNCLSDNDKSDVNCKNKHSRYCGCTKENNGETCTGYQQYLELLQVPSSNLEWGEGSGDDLSSEWESDHTDRSNERTIPKVTVRNDGIVDYLLLRDVSIFVPSC